MFKMETRNLKRLERRLKAQYPKVYAPAMAAAFNKTMTTVRAQGARDISKAMGLKVSDVKVAMKSYRATRQRLQAAVVARDKPISLVKFGASKQLKRGISHRAWGKRRTIKGAFRAPVSGGEQIFIRRGKSAYPIKKLWGPGVARTMGTQEITDGMYKIVDNRLIVTLRQEIKFRTGRAL